MAKDIELLVERSRIVETINTLFVYTDSRKWDLVRSCFAPNVLFDMSSMGSGEPRQMTPDEIVAAWESGLRPIQAVHHQVGNYLVTVENGTASAFCYGIAIHYLPNPTQSNTRTFVGSYDFGLAKSGNRWWITAFKFTLKYVDGNLKLESSL